MRKALYLMGTLNDSDIDWLIESGSSRALAPGEVIITKGQRIDTLYILLNGELQVYSNDLEIARLQPGEVVGEISFIDARAPLASVKAVVDSNVLAIGAELLRNKLGKDASFASRFYRGVAVFLADRLRTTTSRFGYGQSDQDAQGMADPDELYPELLESIDLAALRFDKLLRHVSERISG